MDYLEERIVNDMGMREYYVTGHTADGVVNFLNDNIAHLNEIIVLKHPSLIWKTEILTAYAHAVGEDKLEWLHSRYGNRFSEGVINITQSVAVLTEEALPAQHDFPVKEIHLSETFHLPIYEDDETQVVLEEHVSTSCQHFKEGLIIHDDLEQIYINQINTVKADKLAHELATNVLKNIEQKDKRSIIKRRMFGTNTPDGSVNIVPELTEELETVYMLHGRAGTGKSTLMRHFTNECLEKGLDLELYHCSFDPKSIDMVRVPELSVCVFDATSPHAFSPWKAGQHVIDTYKEFVNQGTDEKYQDVIEEVTNEYKSFMKKGMKSLQRVGKIIEAKERPYELEYENYQSQFVTIARQLMEKSIQ